MSDLFAYAAERRARRTDPATSHTAAERITFGHAHYRAILDALIVGDATIYEIASRAELTHVQVARRMPELELAGRVRPTGETAPSPSGRQCRIWRRR